ncbi:Methyltransferase domain [Ostreococcus tauri]|uniref:Methyltransferase domain n=1 Tax=Ostreococcus tauri TaxID=70448 RepID=A0A090N4L4_OSTTA|nr:Methyltransferase domain [Ostreococcus tauri]CEG00915.1 Methyltransferase domain [Ostreococcus tauri]|eukprot:XP_003074761.2 Methyltransferase domain [Ostreococcus tauri]
MLVEIHAGTIISNSNEIHQSWLSLIVGEQLFGRGALEVSREPVAKRFFQRLYDETFYIFHKEPNIKYSRLHKMCVEFGFIRFDGVGEGALKSSNS